VEETVKRREFLKAGGTSLLAAGAVASPAIAQSSPTIRWRLTSSYPKALDTIHGAAETLAKYVAEATDKQFQIQVFAAGEIVGGLQAADAVSAGTVEMCFTAAQFYWGKDPTFALATGGPFGLNSRLQSAWMYHHGGMEIFNEVFAKQSLYGLPCGNTGAQMGGWFRKEIKTVADLQGLKMRIAGLTGTMLQKLGVVPQQIAGGDIYPALERGTIDAAEWVGPYDDEKLGFVKVAPYYYYPGFWEASAMQHAFINLAEWNKLPEQYKAIIRTAAQATNCDMQAKYDAVNGAALKRLAAKGAQLRPFSPEILEACFEAAQQMYAGFSNSNASFKKAYDSMAEFRSEAYLWLQAAEFTYDAFMMQLQRARKI
jgi:TRAP-type mannitol/chloroaromatic compound transport system substrate-binding protein